MTNQTTTSPILAMHARDEKAWEEYNAIDAEHAQTPNDREHLGVRFRYREAMSSSQSEIDALRLAILYQVPKTWAEAMVLQYHIHIMNDLTDKPSDEDRAALETAIDTLFDFMCCEVEQDHEELGKQFQTSANLVFTKRRYRTGILED